MDACVKSATLSGVDGRLLEVTAVAEPGLPGFEQPRDDCAAALGLRMGEIR